MFCLPGQLIWNVDETLKFCLRAAFVDCSVMCVRLRSHNSDVIYDVKYASCHV